MGLLVDGKWSVNDPLRVNEKGEYIRPKSPYLAFIGEQGGLFTAESGRYHLFVNAGCPWAYRTILYRSIKKLKNFVGITYTQAAVGSEGWTFGADREPLLNAQHIHDVYAAADRTFTGRCTVPVLWDKRQKTIVNNESSDIIRMFDSVFDAHAGVSTTSYYPQSLAKQIDELNEEIYQHVNNGVYRCGFAQSQTAYEAAFDNLFATLDKLDSSLSRQRFLCGDTITEADWRLFATLVRFDTAYYGQFRCNRQRLVDFENLWPYIRDLYQQPDVAETVDLDAIKGIYYGGRPPRIIPKGPDIDFLAPHSRG